MFAIFTQHKTKTGFSDSILLTDGAWINANHKFPDESSPWLKPKLFATRGGAKNYIHKYFGGLNRYSIKRFEQ